MSSPLAGLRSLFTGRAPEKPVDLDSRFEVAPSATEEDSAVSESAVSGDLDFAGEVFGIEYVDTGGHVSRRWVTVEGFKKTPAGDWALLAYCFTRKRVRSFQVDNIRSVCDADGMGLDHSELFRRDGDGAPKARLMREKAGADILNASADGLRVLTALARIDGELHDNEMAALLHYAETTGKNAGLTMSADDKKAVERFIRNQQPTGNVVTASLDRMGHLDEVAQKEFFWHAREVMDADGLQDQAEIKMILEISEAMGLHI